MTIVGIIFAGLAQRLFDKRRAMWVAIAVELSVAQQTLHWALQIAPLPPLSLRMSGQRGDWALSCGAVWGTLSARVIAQETSEVSLS